MWRLCVLAALVAVASATIIGSGQDILQVAGHIPDECTYTLSQANLNTFAALAASGNSCPRPDSSVTISLPVTIAPAVPSVTIPIRCKSRGLPEQNICTGYQWGLGDAAGCAAPIVGAGGAQILTTGVGAGGGDAATIVITNPQWTAYSFLFEDAPRPLCVNRGGGWEYAGIKILVGFNCDSIVTAQQCSAANFDDLYSLNRRDTTGNAFVSTETLKALYSRTTCCRQTATDASVVTNNNAPVGRCVDPNLHTCCGGSAFLKSSERACQCGSLEITATANIEFNAAGTMANKGSICPCQGQSQDSLSVSCPTGETCCLPSKFSELQTRFDQGQCYNPSVQGCCDTGAIYDPGMNQCCSLAGIQSVNTPCACGSDADCQGGQTTPFTNLKCCTQTEPPLSTVGTFCSKYNNFPTAGTPLRCTGTCIDPRYQICCNGQSCRKEFERCCNATCCNTFTESCSEGFRPWDAVAGAGVGFGGSNDFGVRYLICTETEALNAFRSFWVFVLPTVLLLTTLLVSALAIVFANKASSRDYSSIEVGLLVVATLSILFALPTYFSPIYKYGVLVVLVGVLTILSAACRVKTLGIVAVVANVVLLVFLLDPFHGNYYLTLASHRAENGFNPVGATTATFNNGYFPDEQSAGILHLTQKLWQQTIHAAGPNTAPGSTFCTQFYDGYFALDAALRDTERLENPNVMAFGYCSRAWLTFLLIFEGLVIIAVLLQFVLVLLALLLRFVRGQHRAPKVVTTETIVPPVTSYYVQ